MAHPHVWVNARAEVMYDGSGNVSAVKHIWTFDQQYSSFATVGLDANKDGKLSREELKDLAKVNAESLLEFEYFTFAKSAGKKVEFAQPSDYWLEWHNEALTLFLTLPVKSTASGRTFTLEVYDPTFFVSFAFDEGKDAVQLASAASGCSISIKRPAADVVANTQSLSETFFQSLSAASEFGQQFANRAIIACP
jgi:ABC-type uncharacterized transport system substrate-binding protein